MQYSSPTSAKGHIFTQIDYDYLVHCAILGQKFLCMEWIIKRSVQFIS
jgi:hypothetical protein